MILNKILLWDVRKDMETGITNSGVKSNKIWLGRDRFDFKETGNSLKRLLELKFDITGAQPSNILIGKN